MGWFDAVIPAATTLISGYMANKAATKAANAQASAAQAGIDEQRRAAEANRALLVPYTQLGTDALGQMRALSGLSSPAEQQAAIDAISGGAEFTGLNKAGQDAILANASATGGLRGGNVQRSLADYSSDLLNNLINKRLGLLGGYAASGQNAAAGVGSAGMNAGVNIANLLAQQGAANAGGIMSRGNTNINMLSGLGKLASYGMGRFG